MFLKGKKEVDVRSLEVESLKTEDRSRKLKAKGLLEFQKLLRITPYASASGKSLKLENRKSQIKKSLPSYF